MEAIFEKYAQLVVHTGVNLQENQLLVINSPIECAEFAREIAKQAYESGARDVIVSWNDEKLSKIRYTLAKEEVFADFPNWRKELYVGYARENAAFVSILASDPEIFKQVDPKRLSMSQQANGEALKEYRERMMSNKNAWCVVSVPTKAWAKMVFPEASEDEAVDKLWQAIVKATRLDGKNGPVDSWETHLKALEKSREFMNRQRFQSIHFKNALGTDLRVELPEKHIWASGAEYTPGKLRFVANMPTEEVYTLPKFDGVNGTVVSTKPFNYNGSLIEGIELTFEDGEVTAFKAAKGQEQLRHLLSTDSGSCRLGEVALVPDKSPISQSGILFYNTLFDENASCHLAFGKAYPTCLENGENMTAEQLELAGVNESLIHEDFMIGSPDLNITGVTAEGKQVDIFIDGNFVTF